MKVVRHLQRNDTDTEKVVRQLQDRHTGSAGPAYTFHVTGIDKIPEMGSVQKKGEYAFIDKFSFSRIRITFLLASSKSREHVS